MYSVTVIGRPASNERRFRVLEQGPEIRRRVQSSPATFPGPAASEHGYSFAKRNSSQAPHVVDAGNISRSCGVFPVNAGTSGLTDSPTDRYITDTLEA